jgi:hypothetical protein
MLRRTRSNKEIELNVQNLIKRIIEDKHNANDFVVVINDTLKKNGLDTFQVNFLIKIDFFE